MENSTENISVSEPDQPAGVLPKDHILPVPGWISLSSWKELPWGHLIVFKWSPSKWRTLRSSPQTQLSILVKYGDAMWMTHLWYRKHLRQVPWAHKFYRHMYTIHNWRNKSRWVYALPWHLGNARTDRSLTVTLYRKPPQTDQFLQWYSHQNMGFKIECHQHHGTYSQDCVFHSLAARRGKRTSQTSTTRMQVPQLTLNKANIKSNNAH